MREGNHEKISIMDFGDGDNREAFRRFYSAHYREMVAYVSRRADSDDVYDVIAQIFAVAWRKFDQVPDPPDDRLWLFGVARRCLSENRRSALRRRQLGVRLGREGGRQTSPTNEAAADPRISRGNRFTAPNGSRSAAACSLG